jgi:hypothetical protein
VTRDGKPVSQPPQFDQLHRTFGDSWRISQAESLFDYASGENTEKFTDRSFPERERTVNDLTENQREQGRAACRLAGVTDPALLDQCILDVAITGQPSFAVNAGDTQSMLPEKNEPPPGPVNERKVRDGDTVSGRIGAPGERDVYQLDLGDAMEFQLVDQTGDIAIEAENTSVGWLNALIPDANRLSDRSAQASRIVVSRPDNGTGEYSFRVVAIKQRRFDVKIGADGVPGTGRLDVPGRMDVYTLDAGGVSSIRLADHRACNYWVGIAEDTAGSSVPTPYPVWSGLPDIPEGACGTIPIPVEPGKRFHLVVWSKEAKTFDYGFRIEPIG